MSDLRFPSIADAMDRLRDAASPDHIDDNTVGAVTSRAHQTIRDALNRARTFSIEDAQSALNAAIQCQLAAVAYAAQGFDEEFHERCKQAVHGAAYCEAMAFAFDRSFGPDANKVVPFARPQGKR